MLCASNSHFAAVIAGIGALGMETAVGYLGGNRRKGFVVGVVGLMASSRLAES